MKLYTVGVSTMFVRSWVSLTCKLTAGSLSACWCRFTSDVLHQFRRCKPTDCNGYILRTSCHHKKWLKNIPYSQFNRIRRNCSKNIDYEKESVILTEQFKEKGYEDTVIKHAKILCDKKNRNEMLENKNKKEKKRTTPDNNFIQFITTYNNSNKELETIIQRHWHILLKDKDLQEHLSTNPRIIYKKPRTIKQMLVPSCLPLTIQKQQSDPFNTGISNGFFACRTCKGCKTSKVNERNVTIFKSNITNAEFAMKDIITCNSNNVIYLLQCPCNLQYIGRTNRHLKIRIGEHMNNIKKGLMTHCVSAHFKVHHNPDPSLLKFIGIALKKTHWRGGDIVNAVLREETQWIHRLKTLTPQGLNIDIDLKCFLND
ncbi:hypothetical protein XELAEV_18037196mg [Xenopus laevis]|uniref:Helix-turn-helix domain-containing protein n=1 Tax=Xenopus laevis TaxID=8355 RepID=A0A974CCY7_XENLA|nr:hypothetical protein XELAEV_18037196mg [Xenopus laevis]